MPSWGTRDVKMLEDTVKTFKDIKSFFTSLASETSLKVIRNNYLFAEMDGEFLTLLYLTNDDFLSVQNFSAFPNVLLPVLDVSRQELVSVLNEHIGS
jgi:hypothetical protein